MGLAIVGGVSEAFEVSPDDPSGVAEAIRRAAAGATVHVVRDGEPVADIVPAARAAEPDVPDDCEISAEELAEREARMALRPPEDVKVSEWHAARFGAPTLAHYRETYRKMGRGWPGEAFVRRHYLVADPP